MTPLDTANIQRSIINTGLTFQQQDDDRTGEDGTKEKQKATTQQKVAQALNKGGVQGRGASGDIGTQRVASMGTGIGGNHGDDVSRRPRRKHSHRAHPTSQAV